MSENPGNFRQFGTRVAIAIGLMDLVYVAASAIFLNTGILDRVLGMTDETETHIRVRGAISPFPGWIYASKIRVGVRDSSVEIDVDLKDVSIGFRPLRLFARRFDMRHLRVSSTAVKVHLRDESESKRWLKEHPDPERGKPVSDTELERRRAEGWTIHARRFVLTEIPLIAFDEKEFRGRTRIDGGFEFRPTLEAEIFPTRIESADAAWGKSLTNLQGSIDLRLGRFLIPRTEGTEVLARLDADARVTGRSDNFDFVNLTLRSLEGFGLSKGHADFTSRFIVKEGVLRPGSRFETPDGELVLQNDDFSLKGQGFVRWWVDEDQPVSRFLFSMKQADAKARLKGLSGELQAGELRADAVIAGLNLRNPFTGLSGNFGIVKGRYALRSGAAAPGEMRWKAGGSIHGTLSGAADPSDPSLKKLADGDGIRIRILDGEVALPLKTADAESLLLGINGDIRVGGRRLVLTRQAVFPPAVIDLRFADARLRALNRSVRLHFAGNEARLAPDAAGVKTWSGKARLRLYGVNDALDRLKEAEILSGLLRSALGTNTIDAKLGWDMRTGYSRVALESLLTDGNWSASGVLASESRGKTPPKWLGLFTARVIGVPVSLAFGEKGLDWKIDPGLKAPALAEPEPKNSGGGSTRSKLPDSRQAQNQ